MSNGANGGLDNRADGFLEYVNQKNAPGPSWMAAEPSSVAHETSDTFIDAPHPKGSTSE